MTTTTTAIRTLPFTVRPGHRETLDSYTRRTLAANGADETAAKELLKVARADDRSATWETVLAAMTRRSLARLTTPSTDTGHQESASCSPCAALLSERWACLLCSHGEHIQQHPHLNDLICEKHQRWTGPGSTPDTQDPVSTETVAAHRRLRTLRRRGRADMQLLLDVMTALTDDMNAPAAAVFAAAVDAVQFVTRRDTVHKLFDPAVPYSETFAWMHSKVSACAGGPATSAARAVWLHLWPAHIALTTALRGYSGYYARHPHDFALPEDAADWYPRPDRLQSAREYLACTSDSNHSKLAKRVRTSDAPSVTAPLFESAHCHLGHAYTSVITTTDASEDHPVTPCPACMAPTVDPGVNDLATVASDIADELHPTLNGELRATGVAARSSHRLWWVCGHGHPYIATPSNRTLNGSRCSVCLNRVVIRGVNDFATLHPVIARELHPSAASRKRAHQLGVNDTKPRDWVCPDGHEYKMSVKKRVTTRGTCPDCQKQKTRRSGRSLVDTHPELAATWLPELNEGRQPGDYTKGSGLDVIWWCNDGGHPFEMRIEARTRGCGCPYCARRLILEGFNDFSSTHPELAPDWHPWKNRKYPNEVMAGSNEVFQWKCKNGHERPQSIPNRIKSGGCVKCAWHERPGNKPLRS